MDVFLVLCLIGTPCGIMTDLKTFEPHPMTQEACVELGREQIALGKANLFACLSPEQLDRLNVRPAPVKT